ncbi:MAG TPA: alanine racemase [Desulfobacteraceae bacterium]|nr:alanine racemase [Desulfobacteraceae bacterium]HPJ68864.1 alanine racemase [Desulfobacteraceae bacterium]HPQ29192.1 alanine racemase [Desulfobacteraceae bacterium]
MINGSNGIIIDLSALEHNLRQIRALTVQGTRIMGIVKSDAYGHGLLPVSHTLEKANIDCLGVAHMKDALKLRNDGIKLPIIILCGIQTEEESCKVVENSFTPVIFDINAADMLNQVSSRQGRITPVHLKVDTGMGRLGILPGEIKAFIRKAKELKNLNIEALLSHLSSADEHSGEFTKKQIRAFGKTIEAVRSMGLALPFNSLASSAGLAGYPDAHFEMVRPGIMLYGGLPSPKYLSDIPLKPVMTFKGRVLQIRDLPGRTPVSYGRTYYTKGPSRIAVLSAGYGNGLPRNISNLGSVIIKNRRVPIVGTICMDLTMCDVTGLDGVKVGSEVIFLGSDENETITCEDIAGWSDSISYEVLCSIGHQNTKEYIS